MAKVLIKAILTYPNPLMWAINDSGAWVLHREYGLNFTMDRESRTITFTRRSDGTPLEKVFTPEMGETLWKKGIKLELIYSQ